MCNPCPKCGTPMIESALSENHFECPACDLYLSSWAFPFYPKQEPKDEMDIDQLALNLGL